MKAVVIVALLVGGALGIMRAVSGASQPPSPPALTLPVLVNTVSAHRLGGFNVDSESIISLVLTNDAPQHGSVTASHVWPHAHLPVRLAGTPRYLVAACVAAATYPMLTLTLRINGADRAANIFRQGRCVCGRVLGVFAVPPLIEDDLLAIKVMDDGYHGRGASATQHVGASATRYFMVLGDGRLADADRRGP